MKATVSHNKKFNGIDVTFTSKPPGNTIEQLKRMGFRWSQNQGVWYHYYNPQLFEEATRLFGGGEVAVSTPASPIANLTNKLSAITITKAYKQISSHMKIGMSVSVKAWGTFPRGQRPHELTEAWASDREGIRYYLIKPQWTYIANEVYVPEAELKLWIRSLPIKHFTPTPIPDQWKSRAEELARKVDVWFTLIDLESGLHIEFDDPRYKI